MELRCPWPWSESVINLSIWRQGDCTPGVEQTTEGHEAHSPSTRGKTSKLFRSPLNRTISPPPSFLPGTIGLFLSHPMNISTWLAPCKLSLGQRRPSLSIPTHLLDCDLILSSVSLLYISLRIILISGCIICLAMQCWHWWMTSTQGYRYTAISAHARRRWIDRQADRQTQTNRHWWCSPSKVSSKVNHLDPPLTLQ